MIQPLTNATETGPNGQRKVGAVLVQGGGIAGVQAALDLANSGFKVYLVEREAAIGGMMSHLDKTFPTGDCATCILSPKLVECARNLNVEILTLSELIDLEGEPGRFKATVRRHPRYVDESKCNGCSECTQACPVEVLDAFDRDLGKRKAIAKHYAQATPNIFGILKNGHAPCKMACPANVNVQGYVQLIKKKEYAKAVDLIRQRNPLSAICGRVCTHPCESVCTRSKADDPIAIRLLKRFASDKEIEMIRSGDLALPAEKHPAPGAKKVAVIGAGPAGLTVANDLADAGLAVTVYEATDAAGGMLRWGIPEYRLPRDVLDHEIELIRRKGVTFRYNCQVGKDVTIEKLRKENDAVFIGIGTQIGSKLNVDGEDLSGVTQALDFLRQVHSGKTPKVAGKVAVIGGGDAAMDAARTALRLGAENVTVLYRRSATEMPASPEEVKQAQDEGIGFEYLTAPVAFLDGKGGTLQSVRCVRMRLGEPDESGRRRPIAVPNSEFDVPADMAILAIGSVPDPVFAKSVADLPVNKYSNVVVDEHGVSQMAGVFGGGDVVTGPSTVIEAVAAGKRAAESIVRYLSGRDIHADRFEQTLQPLPDEDLPATKGIEPKPRSRVEELAPSSRTKSFAEVEGGFTEADALAEAERCLNCALCSECGECVVACKQNAIDHLMGPRTVELEVGAVVLTPGFQEFDASRKGEFGHGRYPNVVTSIEFERMLSAAGPFEGHVVRLSDRREAKKIAWIQCVGSRDSSCGNEYCSSICCMASTKQAMMAQDHVEGLEATIFYMDIRAYGKDFDQYYERAKNQHGVRYIKSIPSRIVQMPGTLNPRVRFVDETGKLCEEQFDLVVLSVGLEPSRSAVESASRLGIELNDYGFCATDRSAPQSTSRDGVFVGGAFQEPKDIPETVMQASAAASMAMELLARERNTRTVKKKYPDEHDVTDEEPRIGVFVCHCGMNIGSVVDVERVVEAVANQPNVVLATHSMFTCSDTSLCAIRDAIVEHRLNRIVVASCTPRTHEPLFRETLREAGLNPFLFEMANIRDQCSWVHASSPETATQKSIDLVKMAIARSQLLKPLEAGQLTVDQKGLVIGGGLAGMTAALSLANQGFKVHLAERSDRLGGHLHDIHYTLEGLDVAGMTSDLIRQVQDHSNIDVYLGSDVTEVVGHIGEFRATLSQDGTVSEVTAGAVIVATGAEKAKTTKFLSGASSGVITQVDLEKQIHEGQMPAGLKNVVMIQCAGSRDADRAYCSRVCCSMAIKNALAIKAKSPDTNVFVLYRDIRTYGFREIYYKQAREAGVVFIRYIPEQEPQVQQAGGLKVSLKSPDFPEPIEIESDLVVLSTGVQPDIENNRRVSDMLKVPLNADGFYVEAHMKLRPVDFATEGIFLCGLAHSPKLMDESIAQARTAAARAATILSKTVLDVSPQVSWVDQNKCISCMTCVHVCPYGAPFCNTDGKGQIEAAKCMGCGICASECPARAIQLNHFHTDQFRVMIQQLFAANNGEATQKKALPITG
jgi:heterodisulfide reductase subunit A-like polyferredoxin